MSFAQPLTIQICAALLLFCLAMTGSAQRPDWQTETPVSNREEARAQTRLALELDRAGRYAEAIAAYNRALELAPNDAGLYNNLGNALASLGRQDEAVAALQRAIKLSPDFVALIHINLAIVYNQMNQPAQAIFEAKQAIALKPQFVKARVGLCELQLALGENTGAVACYKELLPLVPSDAKAHTNFGIGLVRLKRYKEAAAALKETTRRFPTHPEAYNILGCALIQTKHYREAIVALARALELDPRHESSRFNLALAQLAIKNRAAALEQYAFLKISNATLAQQLYETIYRAQLLTAERK